MKARFNEAAGPKYQLLTYHLVYRLARCMGWFAIFGIGMIPYMDHLQQGLGRANSTLQEWERVKQIEVFRQAPLNADFSNLMDGYENGEEDSEMDDVD